MNFSNGSLGTFTVKLGVADGWAGKKIHLRLGSPNGRTIGTLTTGSTGGWDDYEEQSVSIGNVAGVHLLYLVFEGGAGVATIDSFRFS
jgi:hypothetical protein